MGWLEEVERNQVENKVKREVAEKKRQAENAPLRAKSIAEWERYKSFIEATKPVIEETVERLQAYEERARRLGIYFGVSCRELDVSGPDSPGIMDIFDDKLQEYGGSYALHPRETVKEPYIVINNNTEGACGYGKNSIDSDQVAVYATMRLVYPGKPHFSEYKHYFSMVTGKHGVPFEKYEGMEKPVFLIEFKRHQGGFCNYTNEFGREVNRHIEYSKLTIRKTIELDKVTPLFLESLCKWIVSVRDLDDKTEPPGDVPSWIRQAEIQEQNFRMKGDLKAIGRVGVVVGGGLAVIGLIWLVFPILAWILFVLFAIVIVFFIVAIIASGS